MAEIIVTAAAVVYGLFRSWLSTSRFNKMAKAIQDLELPDDAPESILVRSKRSTATLVMIGQLFVAGVLLLVIIYESPRPPAIQNTIRWLLVGMPVILALLSDHAERSYKRESEALGLNGADEELPKGE